MMPEIDRMVGLIFYMYYYDTGKHNSPHVHVKYSDYELIVDINTGVEIVGYLPTKQRKIALRHIKANKSKLLKMWKLAVNGNNPGNL
ncbi:type II toxin-antitoxin system toxin DhiT [Dickeya fangzhongdai]|uniref:type II toxin-antitoxin system toxin DhiT n=1 Tax=Dickeya fangzhongdai TaxID=1778540 RepID=UPI0026DF0C7E|nr:DUF4160 domain-containing protein [Dickeya fangzhongdai]WKV52171.1 DUF4160 domain-containing protein [Dickeya fangzhongdai]